MDGPAPPCRLRHLAADVIGLPRAAAALLSDRPHPSGFPGLCLPRAASDIDRRVGAADSPFLDRDELVDALERAYADAPEPPSIHPAQRDNLRRLRDPRSQVVVCGQQPGFLGGPLFNLYKAVQTIAVARALEREWHLPVVPLFWVHSDDHDLAEVHHAYVLNRNLDLARVGLPAMGSGRRPIGRIALDAEEHRLASLRGHLLQVLPVTAFREPLLDQVFPREGETLGQAFVRGLCGLLGDQGLLPVEPESIRTPISRALASLLAGDPRADFAKGHAQARAAGAADDLDLDRVPWAFELRDGQRTALRGCPGGFQLDGVPGTRTATEAAAEVVQDPTRWSPSVISRPLVQDACLPIAAYVGGYGELNYHLTLLELRRARSWRSPAFIPRFSATISSPAARTALARLDISAEAFLRRGGSLPDSGSTPSPVAEEIRQMGDKYSASALELSTSAQQLDRSLGPQLKRAAREARALFEKLARKAERIDANRRGKSRRHLRRLQNTWWGRDLPQERSLTALQYAIAFGSDWIPTLIEDIDPFGLEHVLIELSTASADP